MSRGGRRWPPILPWVTLLGVSLGVIGAIAWEVWPWTAEIFFAPARQTSAAPLSAPKTDDMVRVRLLFPQEANGILLEEERDIPRRATFAERVRAVLTELSKVRGSEARSPLPSGVELRQAFLDAFGILYLDFDKKIQALASGDGIRADLATSSIVLTLATNFNEVKRVQFLSEGEELTLLTGGVDFHHPLQPHFPGEEAQPVGSQPQQTTEE
jgi:hypothetical protein